MLVGQVEERWQGGWRRRLDIINAEEEGVSGTISSTHMVEKWRVKTRGIISTWHP